MPPNTPVMPVQISMIVAMDRNRVIGVDNRLPWHLPADLKHFKHNTMGKPIVMGRKTFDSIGKPLPGRFSVVVTRDESWTHDGVFVAHSPERALSLAVDIARAEGVDEVMVIGGETLYRHCMSMAEKLYITEVDIDVRGDAFFPEFGDDEWQELTRENHAKAQDESVGYSFVTYQRR